MGGGGHVYMWFGTSRTTSCLYCLPVALSYITYIAVYCSVHQLQSSCLLQQDCSMFTQVIRDTGYLFLLSKVTVTVTLIVYPL